MHEGPLYDLNARKNQSKLTICVQTHQSEATCDQKTVRRRSQEAEETLRMLWDYGLRCILWTTWRWYQWYVWVHITFRFHHLFPLPQTHSSHLFLYFYFQLFHPWLWQKNVGYFCISGSYGLWTLFPPSLHLEILLFVPLHLLWDFVRLWIWTLDQPINPPFWIVFLCHPFSEIGYSPPCQTLRLLQILCFFPQSLSQFLKSLFIWVL